MSNDLKDEEIEWRHLLIRSNPGLSLFRYRHVRADKTRKVEAGTNDKETTTTTTP